MRKRAFIMAALVGGVLSSASANVFVYDVSVQGENVISYRLLDAAGADVEIEVYGPLPATTVLGSFTGTAHEGLNFVTWTGEVNGTLTDPNEDYGFRVKAAQPGGHEDWTQINEDTNQRFHFEHPRGGVAINNDPLSPLFGLVYIGNTRDSATVSGRTMAPGIYAMYPDASDPIGLADTPATGNVDWTLSGTASPQHIEFGPDGYLYIPDWSDPHAGLWRAPEDLSGTFPEVLTNAGQDAGGLVAGVHGSMAGVWLEMDGENVDIYWMDEELLSGAVPPLGDGARNIYKATITPTTTLPIADPSTLVIDEADFSAHPTFDENLGLFVNDSNGGVARDSEGNFWISNYRAGLDFANLMKFSADGTTLLWDSITAGGATADIVDPLVGNLGGMVFSPDGSLLYVAAGGDFAVLDPANLYTDQTGADAVEKVATGGAIRDIKVDPAGNVYVVSNVTERLSIYSPAGANGFTFDSTAILPGGNQVQTSAEGWNLYQ